MKRTTWLAALAAFLAVAVLFQDAFARSRMYHPTLGRFMQRDVLGYIDGMSMYQYAGGRPIVATDPMGGCSENAGGLRMINRQPTAEDLRVGIVGGAETQGLVGTQECLWQPPGTRATGSIIQHVTIRTGVTKCDGDKEECDLVKERVAAKQDDYYERWDVVKGRLIAPWKGAPTDVTDRSWHDMLKITFSKLNCTAGHATISTEAAFFRGYRPGQWDYGTHEAAEDLPTSPTSPPDGWSDVSGRVGRTVRWEWDYTGDKPAGQPRATAQMEERK